MHRLGALPLALVSAVAACDVDGAAQGVRAPCADTPGGLIGDCIEPVDDAEEACWRLVRCGAIPLAAENGLDWNRCVGYVEGLSAEREDFVLSCVSASSCDDLLAGGSPTPGNGDLDRPLCLQFGDQ